MAVFLFFLSRQPVLMVTDSSFARLYGPNRVKKMESRISRELFRRIIPVYVDENAGPDLVAIAVDETFPSPMAVLIPFRHIEGARYYKDRRPDVPVYVMTGLNQLHQEDMSLTFIRTDAVVDFYRAGLIAAFFAGENVEPSAEDGQPEAVKRILFVSEGSLPDEQREAFLEGLRVQGHSEDPVWGYTYTDYSSRRDLSCAVLAAPVAHFVEQNPSVPVILFSWADPSFIPKSVKFIFDDSLLTLAARVLKTFPPLAGEFSIHSDTVVMKNHIEGEKDFRKLKSLIKEFF